MARPPEKRRSRLRRWWIPVLVFLALVVIFFGYSACEARHLQVEPYTITSPEIPAEFNGARIVFLTDVHRAWFFSQDRVRSLVAKVNDLSPDLVLLGGDYIDRSTQYAVSCFSELAHLQAPLGRYAVLGNHDYGIYDDAGWDPTPVVAAIEDAGITLLDNQGVWIEKGHSRIRLGGVADLSEGWPWLHPIIEGTEVEDFVILVSHNPDYAEQLPVSAVDLMLAGHTHGGQITFFGLWAPYVPSEYGQEYRAGLVDNGDTTVIVSNGVGTIFPPLRFFAPPQIVIITLQNEPAGR